MFDKYIIDPATLRNTGPADAPTGFAFESKLGYYLIMTLHRDTCTRTINTMISFRLELN